MTKILCALLTVIALTVSVQAQNNVKVPGDLEVYGSTRLRALSATGDAYIGVSSTGVVKRMPAPGSVPAGQVFELWCATCTGNDQDGNWRFKIATNGNFVFENRSGGVWYEQGFIGHK